MCTMPIAYFRPYTSRVDLFWSDFEWKSLVLRVLSFWLFLPTLVCAGVQASFPGPGTTWSNHWTRVVSTNNFKGGIFIFKISDWSLTPTPPSSYACSPASWPLCTASPQCSTPRTSGFQKTRHRSWNIVWSLPEQRLLYVRFKSNWSQN